MGQTITLPTSLKNIRQAYSEIAEHYGLQEIDVERSLDEAIEQFYGTSNFWLSGDGLQLNGRYKTMHKKEFFRLYAVFMDIVKKEHSQSFLSYIEQLLALNENILYCELSSFVKKDNVYILKPMRAKDRPLPHMVVSAKTLPGKNGSHVMFPEGLKRIPVYIKSIKRNKKAKSDIHAVLARGVIMNDAIAQKHLEILNKRFQKKYDIELNLKVAQNYDNGVKLKYTSIYTLPVDATKIIGNYFRSFNVQAYIEQ